MLKRMIPVTKINLDIEEEVWVNPYHICLVEPSSKGGNTRITFTNGKQIEIKYLPKTFISRMYKSK